MSDLRFWDVVRKKRQKDEGTRLFFPTLCVCHRCHGYRGFTHDGKTYEDKDLTVQLAIAQFGYQIAPNFDNDPPNVDSFCDCAEKRVKLQGETDKLPVTDWGKWEPHGGSPTYGITDYKRVVQVDRELEKPELKIVCEYLRRDEDCPGWTGVIGTKIKHPGIYRFTTTWDSSG